MNLENTWAANLQSPFKELEKASKCMLWIRFTYNPHSMNCEKGISLILSNRNHEQLGPRKRSAAGDLKWLDFAEGIWAIHSKINGFCQEEGHGESIIKPVLPAVTCTAQSTYLTGKLPNEHGVVANGWYDRDLNEHHFGSNPIDWFKEKKVWESIRKQKPGFTCANLFWWYNMYSSVDFSITPRPFTDPMD